MTILSIDPGTEKSAFVLYAPGDPSPIREFGIVPNGKLLELIWSYTMDRESHRPTYLAYEGIQSYGMAVGKETFETVFWSGRFYEAWVSGLLEPGELIGIEPIRVYRHEVKLHLCGQTRAKDANIRTAIIDRFGPGKEKAIGVKARHGPLYKISSHCWSALAVALTAANRLTTEREKTK